jgi:predicted DNA-binding protein with PD1-like motif
MEFDRCDGQYVLRLDPDEEVMNALREFAARENIHGAYFQGIGAFSGVDLRWFDIREKRYKSNQVNRQVEVVGLIGSIAWDGAKPVVHVHLSVADDQAHSYSGHLSRGTVRPTLELFLTTFPKGLRRRKDPASGLELLAFGPAADAA